MGQYLFRLSGRRNLPELPIDPFHVFFIVFVLIGLIFTGFLMTTSFVKAEPATVGLVNYNVDYSNCQIDRLHVGLSGCSRSQSMEDSLVLNGVDSNLPVVYVGKNRDLFDRSRGLGRDSSKVQVDTPKWVWGLVAFFGGCAIAGAVTYRVWLRRRSGR